MATFAIKIVLLIAALVLANAFRSVKLGNRALSLGRRHAASTMTDEEVVAAYDKIFEKTVASISPDLPPAMTKVLTDFLSEYKTSNLEAAMPPDVFVTNLSAFMKSIQSATQDPYQFKPYHQAIKEPFNYYKWGNDFLKPLIIKEKSKLVGKENAERIKALLEQGDNIVILSNHQTEADPQVISVLFEESGYEAIAEKMIFIAGHKVTSDPVCIPFSMGRNLICIHSKKHIANPPEDRPRKTAQNLESVGAMGDLMKQGGHIFWVAPSGGRDRPGPENDEDFVVSPFDGKTLDMFRMMAYQSGKPMHFFPMAMYTNKLVPPPKEVSSELGEGRSGKRGPVSVTICDETDGIGGLKDKEFNAAVQGVVEAAYEELNQWHKST